METFRSLRESDGIAKYLNRKTGRYDYLNREFKPKDLVKDGKFIVPIGIWEGNFNCSHTDLTSLKGAPEVVEGYFDCSHNQLTSLEGAPKKVGGDFSCSFNKLSSLEGAPREVGGDFKCTFNMLVSLEGAPEVVGGYFDCRENKLTSLKGAPEVVGGNFDCSGNHLTSLEGAPRKVGGDFWCNGKRLTSLDGKFEDDSPAALRKAYREELNRVFGNVNRRKFRKDSIDDIEQAVFDEEVIGFTVSSQYSEDDEPDDEDFDNLEDALIEAERRIESFKEDEVKGFIVAIYFVREGEDAGTPIWCNGRKSEDYIDSHCYC